MMVRLKALLSVLFFILSCCAVVAQQFPTKLFDVPDGARPHDVAPAPNGLIWYTAQRQGALGILDPNLFHRPSTGKEVKPRLALLTYYDISHFCNSTR